MLTTLVLLSFSTLISEDLACIAAGALVAGGQIRFLPAVVSCFAGILAGDLLLFALGRLAGTSVARWPLFARKLEQAKVLGPADWLRRNPGRAIVASRFVPGTRLPTYVAAGLLRLNAWRFLLWFAIASAIWTPLLVGATVQFGREAIWKVATAGERAGSVGVFAAASLLTLRWLTSAVSRYETRRKLRGWALRKVRWEFWPVWAVYLPLLPWFCWLALKHRSALVFTAANPAMPAGGLLGESKSQILDGLSGSGAVARHILLPGGEPPEQRMVLVRRFMERCRLTYPIVVKPNVGERGAGVCIAESDAELEACLQPTAGDVIVQEYVDGREFGVFYYRLPGFERGRILSITAKHFPSVVGDGASTLKELILRDPRAVAISSVYLRQNANAENIVPASGEFVRLVNIGSHSRGAVFLDGSHLLTEQLERRIDEISKTFRGFFFGRYDLRSPSEKAMRAGQVTVLELNGVSSEPTHIYDPAVSIFDAYRALAVQWRTAYEIGALNRDAGHPVTRPGEILRMLRERYMR